MSKTETSNTSDGSDSYIKGECHSCPYSIFSSCEIYCDSDCESDCKHKPKCRNCGDVPKPDCTYCHWNDLVLSDKNKDTFIQTPDTVKRSFELSEYSFPFINDEFLTFDFCSFAIELDGDVIAHIKRELFTPEDYYKLCIKAVERAGYSILSIPEDVHTQELWDIAFRNGGYWAIDSCREEFKTYETCLFLVSVNGEILKHVPQKYIDMKMCMTAVKSSYECLEMIPKELITREMCEEAVKASGINIKFVPEEFITPEMCLIAVKSAGYKHYESVAGSNMRYVPQKYLTREIILEAVKRSREMYSYIPKEFLNEEFENAILDVSPFCIELMSQTPEKCIRAIRADPRSTQLIKKKNYSKEVVDFILSLPIKEKDEIRPEIIKYITSLF